MSQDTVPLPLRRRVRERAGDRCEYCGVSQDGQEATFHVDHIRPRRDAGTSDLANLALACVSCSLRKGARTTVTDPDSGQTTACFNPRIDEWQDHFSLDREFSIVGKTPIGTATVQLLRMNRPLAIAIRREAALRRRIPTKP